jgi:hypothetical protein
MVIAKSSSSHDRRRAYPDRCGIFVVGLVKRPVPSVAELVVNFMVVSRFWIFTILAVGSSFTISAETSIFDPPDRTKIRQALILIDRNSVHFLFTLQHVQSNKDNKTRIHFFDVISKRRVRSSN